MKKSRKILMGVVALAIFTSFVVFRALSQRSWASTGNYLNRWSVAGILFALLVIVVSLSFMAILKGKKVR